jgi:uncharacterized protein YcfL
MRKGRLLVSLLLVFSLLIGCSSGQTPPEQPPKPAEQKKTGEEPATEDEVSAELKAIQKEVDSGQQTWRLDPVAVTKETVIGDSYRVISNDKVKSAVVEVKQGKKKFRVYLTKPVRQDKTGIWYVQDVKEVE